MGKLHDDVLTDLNKIRNADRILFDIGDWAIFTASNNKQYYVIIHAVWRHEISCEPVYLITHYENAGGEQSEVLQQWLRPVPYTKQQMKRRLICVM